MKLFKRVYYFIKSLWAMRTWFDSLEELAHTAWESSGFIVQREEVMAALRKTYPPHKSGDELQDG